MIRFRNIYLTGSIPDKAYEWRNDLEIYKFCRQHTQLSKEEHNKYINNLINNPTIKLYGIKNTDKEDIGVCGLTSINYIHRSAEFSLYIAPEFRGKGYAKSALIALMREGFNSFNLNRIWGEVFAFNSNALEMFKCLGFKTEGILRESYFKNGEYTDSIIIGKLSRNFNLEGLHD